MNIILENRLKQYTLQSKQDELNALKEIFQEIALAALSRTDFFKYAAFQGGTCLRILYGLPRFSEDLDFVLLKTDPNFQWSLFLKTMQLEFEAYGLHLEATDRSKADIAIKKAFLKERSFGQSLTLSYPRNTSDTQSIQIKLEIDINPPEGSAFEVKYLDFPYPFSLTLQDRPSLFAGKCHALLCRKYVKGRDWFDFIWYVTQKTPINYDLLEQALYQTGPWEKQPVGTFSKDWVFEQLHAKIFSVDWIDAKKDVAQFLKPREAESLPLWNKDFFLHYCEQLKTINP